MSDRLLREIRDRLTALVALVTLLVVMAGVGTGIMVYWHVKADAARQRLVAPDQAPNYPPVNAGGLPLR